MSNFAIRALLHTDLHAFVEFEHNNRDAFELFNEPHPSHYYSDAGLAQAFKRLMERQRSRRYLTRITTGLDPEQWVAKGSLAVHRVRRAHFGRLVYQADRGHLRQGLGTLLLADLLQQAQRLHLQRVEASIAVDNLVSLHLLRRAGFTAVGWEVAAQLRRGPTDCLQLGRSVRPVDGADQPRPHMHLPT